VADSGADPPATAADADGADCGPVQVRPLRADQPPGPVQANLDTPQRLPVQRPTWTIFLPSVVTFCIF
jgi:hypothetical protein